MNRKYPYRDKLKHLAQVGSGYGVQLVRLTSVLEENRYNAKAVEFETDGSTKLVSSEIFTVTNLAEPADTTGQVPEDTDAVAVDVEGKWVVFVRPSTPAAFPARVVSSQGSAVYTVKEQVITGSSTFQDKSGASNLNAINLAELTIGSGAAVDDDTKVLVREVRDNGDPPTSRYVFDHPTYAKYLS